MLSTFISGASAPSRRDAQSDAVIVFEWVSVCVCVLGFVCVQKMVATKCPTITTEATSNEADDDSYDNFSIAGKWQRSRRNTGFALAWTGAALLLPKSN